DLDVQVRRGRITAIMGPSGTGKTTLLKLITAQVPPDQGELRVFGQELATLGRREVYALRRRMGMLFQNGALLTDMDVFENVASHDVQELATIADDSYLISGGRVAASGTPAQLRASDSPAVRQFMTGGAEGPVPFHYPAPDYATQLLVAEE